MLGVKRAYFPKHGVTFAIFLIGGQNRNILKLRGQKMQFSLFFYQKLALGSQNCYSCKT